MSLFKIGQERSREEIQEYLHATAWMPGETVHSTSKAGEGNMNVILRVSFFSGKSLILKQSRPYVNKFPSIPAPPERIETENAFYQLVRKHPELSDFMPRVIGFDRPNRILALEDLGEGSDYTFIYKKDSSWPLDLNRDALRFLSILHHLPVPEGYPSNLALRQLNAEHLFDFPYRTDHGFDLDKVQYGLEDLARPYREDLLLREAIKGLKKIYLGQGGRQLLHGDYFPGGWLQAGGGFKVIDPEFSFIGPAEYDLGIMMAHLFMARQDKNQVAGFCSAYDSPSGFSDTLCWQFCGMEIFRRLIGLAQLPVDLSLEEKASLLKQAYEWVTGSGQASGHFGESGVSKPVTS
ncbi:MAG TPA: phosphotransferase [Saprospiraceae bacterium]|nr:phosphotransferase [Saprospiraceae bacterium]HNT21642.1 phosphotransferase [Saprospiraceae bacterium]